MQKGIGRRIYADYIQKSPWSSGRDYHGDSEKTPCCSSENIKMFLSNRQHEVSGCPKCGFSAASSLQIQLSEDSVFCTYWSEKVKNNPKWSRWEFHFFPLPCSLSGKAESRHPFWSKCHFVRRQSRGSSPTPNPEQGVTMPCSGYVWVSGKAFWNGATRQKSFRRQ